MHSRVDARFKVLCPLLLALLAWAGGAQALDYPQTAKKAVADSYHGVQVSDEYRWLEDANDPAVKAWSVAQLKVTRGVLDAWPAREALRKRFKELYETAPVRYYGFFDRGEFFATKRQPPKNQPFLVVMKAAGDVASESVLVDPNSMYPKGTTTIDFYVPSLDGKYVAVSLSEGGSEDGSVHVFETRTGMRVEDPVPRVQAATAGGSVAWDEKGTGFYYTRYPQGKERAKEDLNFYQQVYFHKLGTPSGADTYVIGKEFPRIAETQLSSTRDGRYLLASVANGDGGEVAYYLRDPDGRGTKVADQDHK